MARTLSSLAVAASAILLSQGISLSAQTSIQLFGSTYVRDSTDGASPSSPIAYNSATAKLTCAAGAPIRAVLSSTPDGSGNVLVDNFVNVTVTGGSASGPVNVCRGGTTENGASGIQNNCFSPNFRGTALTLIGVNMDTLASVDGVAPIDISSLFAAGALEAKIDLVDTGSVLANASLYLVTSCTQAGATGPATITGNPIPSNNPPPGVLDQDFTFNPTPGQDVGFGYDLSTAYNDGTLSITDQTIPNVSDAPLDPSLWQPQYAAATSFATSSCIVHNGELLNGSPACKLFTLTCQVGTGASSTGAQCPVSQLRDEVFSDTFSGPPITLPDISGPNGHTYHTGVGFLMASEGWTGGPCTYDPASGLGAEICPQNLLTSFTSLGAASPGQPSATPSVAPLARLSLIRPFFQAAFALDEMDFDGTGTHPNSTFISVSQVPEDLTTVTIAGAHAGGWINTHNFTAALSSEPPVLPPDTPNYQNFIASPLHTITYGISPADSLPGTRFPVPGDTTLTNPIACPSPGAPLPATVFSPETQHLTVASDGQYLLHYFAQDCAGTEELKFTSGDNSAWSTSFYTVPVNVDTVPPVLVSGATLSAQPSTINGTPNAFTLNQSVTVTYRCTDDASGVASCGPPTWASPGTLDTGLLTLALDTSSLGAKTLTVPVTDIAGNTGTAFILRYSVVSAASADITALQIAPSSVKSGKQLTYDVLVLNSGPKTADNVVLTDTLPPGVTFVSAGYESVSCALFGGCSAPRSSTCTVSGTTVTCNAGSLKPLSLFSISGIGVQIVVKVTAPAGTALTNTVHAQSSNADPNPGNNTSTVKTTVK